MHIKNKNNKEKMVDMTYQAVYYKNTNRKNVQNVSRNKAKIRAESRKTERKEQKKC